MLTDIYPVRWAGPRAVVTLPEYIAASDAGQIREELLSVINRGATTVIADMTTTISCDQAGTDAVVRACQRAVISGAELRLVVTVPSARRMLGLGGLDGLDGLVSIYPSLEAALAAEPTDPNAAVIPPAERAYRSLELLDTVVSSLFHIGLSLHVAMDLPADAARERIAAAVARLDETIREVRNTAFTARGHESAPRTSPLDDTAQELPLPERQELPLARARLILPSSPARSASRDLVIARGDQAPQPLVLRSVDLAAG
jgi:anti-anti-sigma regulatory factor